MRKILISIIISLGITAQAQQLSLYSQFKFSTFLMNPGLTGQEEYMPVRLIARQQWQGLDDAPSTQALSAHSRIGRKNMAVGGYIFADRFGPETKLGVQLNYAYLLNVFEDSKLAFGISVKGFQYQIDSKKLKAVNESDVRLNQEKNSAWVPDADFGVGLYNDRYYVGLSANQLIELPISLNGETINDNSMVRHYYLLGGYKWLLSDNFTLEPSALIKATEHSPVQVDFNVLGYYKKNYWLGCSYRSSNDVTAMAGLKYQKFVFGVAYDYTFSEIRNFQSGSFEIMLGYNFFEKTKSGSSLL